MSKSSKYSPHSHHLRCLNFPNPLGSHRCLCEVPHFVFPSQPVLTCDGRRLRRKCGRGPSRCVDVCSGGTAGMGCSCRQGPDEWIITGVQISVLCVGGALSLSTSLTWHPFVCTLQCRPLPFCSGPVATWREKKKKRDVFFIIQTHCCYLKGRLYI